MKATSGIRDPLMQASRQDGRPRIARLCGVDGCKYGWIALLCEINLSNIEWRLARSWNGLTLTDEVIAVDMPIGLAARGKRGCDEAARKDLGRKASSVFPMPVREVFAFEEYAQANVWSKANGHGGVVKQAWHLGPKVLELEAAALSGQHPSIFEAHPELAFARINNGTPLPPKRSTLGLSERLKLLEDHGIAGLDRHLAQMPKGGLKPDDLVDAAVLLLTAQRIATGRARCLPDEPLINAQGLPMAIWV
ncbi:MAG TPA: DUF429 domain-containing protein [Alphaproteobacteria bacterium]|nr:DUF429 domain-containing protein [Alphaproteobacteria bacterium]HAJ45170.1 DUF429 domain-containing protein [Alphaproteobacteria bacterium]